MPMKSQRGDGCIAPTHLQLGHEIGISGEHHGQAALTPGKIRYPLYRRLVWPHGQYGRTRKILRLPNDEARSILLTVHSCIA